jgi:galactokinase
LPTSPTQPAEPYLPFGTLAGELAGLDPVPTLRARVAAELSAAFDPARPIRLSRAPGRLDVMGGIADYTGSLVAEGTIDRAAAVALQPRADRQVQVMSFNLLDDHKPFTFQASLDALATTPPAMLREGFAAPGRQWAAYLAGCLAVLHHDGLIDLTDPDCAGVNLAVLSTVPIGAGVSSSAAVEVATMVNLVAHFGLVDRLDPMALSSLCQRVENAIVGAPCGIMDQVTCCYGRAGSLLRMVCQPHALQPALHLPAGVKVVGMNSRVRHSIGGGQYGRTRCAAFMGHAIILDRMRQMGRAAGQQLVADPMHGHLANLDPEDYKVLFRPHVPEQIDGRAFLDRYGPTLDRATAVDPDRAYAVQHATDHHVLEARRVRRFVAFLEQATTATGPARKLALDQAGHLMYASHLSYTNDAMLGADECDLLVELARAREPAGLYGAKITGGGSGGTVAILCDDTPAADAAVAEVMAVYQQRTGLAPEAITGTSPGAWHTGTIVV